MGFWNKGKKSKNNVASPCRRIHLGICEQQDSWTWARMHGWRIHAMLACRSLMLNLQLGLWDAQHVDRLQAPTSQGMCHMCHLSFLSMPPNGILSNTLVPPSCHWCYPYWHQSRGLQEDLRYKVSPSDFLNICTSLEAINSPWEHWVVHPIARRRRKIRRLVG